LDRTCKLCKNFDVKTWSCQAKRQPIHPESPLAENCQAFEEREDNPLELKLPEPPGNNGPWKEAQNTASGGVKTGTILDKLPSAIDIPKTEPIELPGQRQQQGQSVHPAWDKDKIRETALYFLNQGINLIPLPWGRKDSPLVSWKKYQEERVTPEQLDKWLNNKKWIQEHGGVNLAVVCGKISNLIVLDFDVKESYFGFLSSLPKELRDKVTSQCIIVETGKGFHVYIRPKNPEKTPNVIPEGQKAKLPGVSVRGEGSYAVAPGSLHPSGTIYRFVNKPERLGEFEDQEIDIILGTVKDINNIIEAGKEIGEVKEDTEKLPEIGPGEWKTLAQEDIDKIVELLKPAYIKNHRHWIRMWLSGWGAFYGIHPLSLAEVFLKLIYDQEEETRPDFIRKKLGDILDTYKRYFVLAGRKDADQVIETLREEMSKRYGVTPYVSTVESFEAKLKTGEIKGLAGKGSLEEEITASFIEQSRPEEEAKKEANRIIMELKKILGKYRERKRPDIELTDWENWKRLGDPFLQIKLLSEWARKKKRGIFEDEFRQWVNTRYNGKSIDQLSVDEKAFLMWEFLEERGLINVFKVPQKEGFDLMATLGNSDILFDLDSGRNTSAKWVSLLASSFFGITSPRLVNAFLDVALAMATPIERGRIDPLHKLRLKDAVLDLETLELTRIEDVNDPYYFTYYAPLFTKDPLKMEAGKTLAERIRDIKEGKYDIEQNKVYKYFRKRFDDTNWRYFVSAIGTILSPYRHKLVVFLIGGTDAGKSTLIKVLTKPIEPIVGRTQLREIMTDRFALESLIGKQILISYERGEEVLRRLDLLNTIFGDNDEIDVPRKFKSYGKMKALKMGLFAMNDPPRVTEYGGETMRAFANRLSIIHMLTPEEANDQKIVGLADQISMEEAFEFLVWCRVQLEQNGWIVEKMDANEVIDYLKRETNTVYQFLDNSQDIIQDPNGKVKGENLYQLYLKWCEEKGITPYDRNNFYTFVAKEYERIDHDKSPDNSVWFKGLKITKKQKTTTYELGRFEA
jgi:phage/plasmid-associated DNA primase